MAARSVGRSVLFLAWKARCNLLMSIPAWRSHGGFYVVFPKLPRVALAIVGVFLVW